MGVFMNEVKKLMKRSKKVIEKRYSQFDTALTVKSAEKFLRSTVLKTKKVEKYRFYPFIIYKKKKIRYHRTKNKLRAHVKIKERPISLVAHRDALIYVAYAEKLSHEYEVYLREYGIEYIPTAYRKGLHYSNITAAKEVFDFIVDSNNCWIIKGDFKGFFDNIRHKILYSSVCKILNVDKLEPDWNAVIKSLTKYRSVDKDELISALNRTNIKYDKKGPYINERQEIEQLISKGGLIIKGPNQIGIPQGTSLSAVLANVYMIDFDEVIKKLVESKKGLYRRYSDDFVIVIPKKELSENQIRSFSDEVKTYSKEITKLTIETEKTKIFSYTADSSTKMALMKLDSNIHYYGAWFDYLGFIFNGDTVRLRDRSIYKFHYKGKKAIHLMNRIKNDRRKIVSNSIPEPYEKSRMVWKSGQHVFENTSQYSKQKNYEKRIFQTRKNINYNLTHSGLVSRIYLTSRRYGERYSMVGYAKRAQKIMSNNSNRYDVDVLEQVERQIHKNQRDEHRLRVSNERD